MDKGLIDAHIGGQRTNGRTYRQTMRQTYRGRYRQSKTEADGQKDRYKYELMKRDHSWRMGRHGHRLTTLTNDHSSTLKWPPSVLAGKWPPEVANFTKAAILVMNCGECIRHLLQPTTTKLISGRRWQCVPLALLSDTDIGNGAGSRRSNACIQVNG